MAKMYELTDAYASLLEQYDDAETDAEREDILRMMREVEIDLVDKAENIARIMKNADAEANALDVEIKRLQRKKKAAENLSASMKENMFFSMGIAGATELKTGIGKWWIQKNPPKVNITDEMMVPARFLVEQPPEFDKKAILAEFKQTGEILPGITIERSESVRFR